MSDPVLPLLLGRFEWSDLPFVRAWENPTISEVIGAGAGALVIVGALALAGCLPSRGVGAGYGRNG